MPTTKAKPSFQPAPEHSFEEQWSLAQVRYKGTIRTFARSFLSQIRNMDQADIEQELLVVLWQCVIKYDPAKGASFNTLFQGCAKNKCISLVRTANTKSRKGVNVSLADEDIERAVDDYFQEESAEDRAIIQAEVRQAMIDFPNALRNGAKRGRKAKVA